MTRLSCGILGSVRLMNGQHDYEGRVEVYHNGAWGTVCDDGWDIEDATVVCRQLGFTYGFVQSYKNAQFGPGTGQIWLDDVACSGQESRLEACSHAGWAKENCIHDEDVGVSCMGELLFKYYFVICNTISQLFLNFLSLFVK